MNETDVEAREASVDRIASYGRLDGMYDELRQLLADAAEIGDAESYELGQKMLRQLVPALVEAKAAVRGLVVGTPVAGGPERAGAKSARE